MKVTTPFLWAALWLVGLSFFATPVARACANHHYPNPHDHEDHPALGVVPPRYLVEEDVFLPEEDLFFEEEEDDHYCSTHPTEDDIRQGTDTMTDYATRRRLQKNKETSPIVVPVVIHRILYTQERPLGATDEQVAAQMEVLNDAFAPHFSFVLTDQTKTVNATWYRFLSLDTPELIAEMKAALHQGGPETLNVYINFFRGAGGIATFPQAVKKDPILDGIIIKVSTMPGGRITSKQGKTAVHEVGHWLGLYHTFMGGCREPNDYVKDTNPQASATQGCPEFRDSCGPGSVKGSVSPFDNGPDPIHNYMDYSDDACQTEFTPGQVERMLAHWHRFREPRGKHGDGSV